MNDILKTVIFVVVMIVLLFAGLFAGTLLNEATTISSLWNTFIPPTVIFNDITTLLSYYK